MDKIISFISDQAKNADKDMNEFIEFVEPICRENKGSHLKIGTKIRNINDKKAIDRVI